MADDVGLASRIGFHKWQFDLARNCQYESTPVPPSLLPWRQ
jgi:hypothetical protein